MTFYTVKNNVDLSSFSKTIFHICMACTFLCAHGLLVITERGRKERGKTNKRKNKWKKYRRKKWMKDRKNRHNERNKKEKEKTKTWLSLSAILFILLMTKQNKTNKGSRTRVSVNSSHKNRQSHFHIQAHKCHNKKKNKIILTELSYDVPYVSTTSSRSFTTRILCAFHGKTYML